MLRHKLFLNKVQQARRAKEHLLDFTQFTFPGYEVNWHHRVVCNKLDDVLSGKITRLMIFQPPRTGKSELVSRRLPALALGRDPNEQIIAATYAAELGSQFNRAVQRIIDDYPYKTLFPETTLMEPNNNKIESGDQWVKTQSFFEVVNHRGYYRSVGVGGAITGMGATLGLVDDPFKNRQEADSKVYRDRVWDWFASTFLTRLEKNARVIITLTRWHEDDVAGRIQELAKVDPNADQYEIIMLPMEAGLVIPEYDPRAPGEVLWPNKFSKAAVQKIKANIGSREFASLYQQSPQVEGGNIVKREWWKFYQSPPDKFDDIIQSWDLMFKETGTSYVVGQVWGRKGVNKYLLDQFRNKCGFVETISAIKTMCAKHPLAMRILIEDKANGPAVIDSLKSQISGIVPVSPDGSKESRLHAVSAQIEAGNVWLPERATFVHDYIEEFSQFPNGADDDQVDATTQALRHFSASGIERLERLLKM